jgi:enediyne biosynthesis protein E4
MNPLVKKPAFTRHRREIDSTTPSVMKTISFIVFVAVLQSLLSALAQPALSRQPTDASVSLGATAQFRVTANSASLPIAYRWWFNEAAINTLANPSAAKNLLSLTNVTAASTGPYFVVVSDASGLSVTSRVASLTVDRAFTKITTGSIVTDRGDWQAAGWADYDGDGYLDVFVANIGTNALYHNNQDGTFTRITGDAVAKSAFSSSSFVWGDYDNDGNPDLFVATYSGQNNLLYRNNGMGTFTRITNNVRGTIVNDGGNSSACSWGDYDQDGFLDLLAANWGEKSFLYRNQGDGTFTKITSGPVVSVVGNSYGCPWADYDNDGDLDLFVGNDGNNFLYQNQGNGSFVRITNSVVVRDAKGSDGSAWADYDHDGNLDLFVTNLGGTGNALYQNRGSGTLAKVTNTVVTLDKVVSTSCSWGDYDNDGFIDLFVACGAGALVNNLLYHNNGDGTFGKVTEGSLVNDGGASLGCAWADYDNDGFLDLFIANGAVNGETQSNFLYRNNGNTNGWLKVKLVGTASNRDAIGAKVSVRATVGGRDIRQLREISSGDGFSGNSAVAHFGLGDATKVTTLRIEWPSGALQEMTDVASRQFLTVSEPARLHVLGAGVFRIQSWKGQAFEVQASEDVEGPWSPLTTVTNLTGTLDYTDATATRLAQRFYRVKSR